MEKQQLENLNRLTYRLTSLMSSSQSLLTWVKPLHECSELRSETRYAGAATLVSVSLTMEITASLQYGVSVLVSRNDPQALVSLKRLLSTYRKSLQTDLPW